MKSSKVEPKMKTLQLVHLVIEIHIESNLQEGICWSWGCMLFGMPLYMYVLSDQWKYCNMATLARSDGKKWLPFLICLCRYALEVIKIPGVIKEALKKLKSSHPRIKAIFMGTRKSDPKAGASYLLTRVLRWGKGMEVTCWIFWGFQFIGWMYWIIVTP